jgi:lipoate-protein ligase A
MSESWFLLQSGPGGAAVNMAMDEALLEHAIDLGQPVLRFYGWTESAATFGYSQRFRDVSTWSSLRPLIRRPTGGGLVPHDADWTYSLIFPAGHWWYRLRAVESYRLVHEWIHAAFGSLGLATQLAPAPHKAEPGRCFVGAEKFDLLYEGGKLAGAAQRRTAAGLLIQGSIQPRGVAARRGDWEGAMLRGGSLPEKVIWNPLRPEAGLMDRAARLAEEKYSQRSYNERR